MAAVVGRHSTTVSLPHTQTQPHQLPLYLRAQIKKKKNSPSHWGTISLGRLHSLISSSAAELKCQFYLLSPALCVSSPWKPRCSACSVTVYTLNPHTSLCKPSTLLCQKLFDELVSFCFFFFSFFSLLGFVVSGPLCLYG